MYGVYVCECILVIMDSQFPLFCNSLYMLCFLFVSWFSHTCSYHAMIIYIKYTCTCRRMLIYTLIILKDFRMLFGIIYFLYVHSSTVPIPHTCTCIYTCNNLYPIPSQHCIYYSMACTSVPLAYTNFHTSSLHNHINETIYITE